MNTETIGTRSTSSSGTQVALAIAGLRQVIGIPGTNETFTLHVNGLLEVSAGGFVGILGQTGCGKTTLLTVLGLLRGATNGSELSMFQMKFRGGSKALDLTDIWRKNRSTLANRLRRQHLGFALQQGELLPTLTVAENIAFPLRLNGWDRRSINDRVAYLIESFRLYRSFDDETKGTECKSDNAGVRGLSSLASVRVNHLSGGQYQRVALARAVAHQPEFLFVDEPTASLNRSVARTALQQLAELRSEAGERSTIFMVTHDEQFAEEFCNQIVRMRPLTSADEPSQGPAGEVIFESHPK